MTARDATLLNVVKEAIRDRLSDAVNVSMLSAALGLSRSHFSRAFRKATGEPPRVYISRLRLRHAMSLMRESHISLSDIALAAGFADHAHFSNAFRRATGATPSQWRRSLA
jgi:transcriptional regulator GlxA family with amidase domain